MSDLSKGDWEQFLSHPCWTAFYEHAKQEWGPGGQRFESSINKFADSREDDALVLNQIRQIAVSRREILRLLEWPHEEASRLSQPHASSQVRQPLAPELAGQSRRGGL